MEHFRQPKKMFLFNCVLHWFTREWWRYLLEPRNEEYSWFEVIRCRANGHPCGVAFYNAMGFEPDMTCKGCGDDLG